MDADVSPETWVVLAGRAEHAGAPLNIPITPASNFLLGADRSYSRSDSTPGWEALEAIVGGLEGGEAVGFASGMAAAAAVLRTQRDGARILLPTDCYQGVAGLVDDGVAHRGWSCTRLDVADTAAWTAAMAHADVTWLESPTNPLLDVADLPTLGAAPRKPGSLLVVDNTLATPLNQRPLDLGADVVMHAATKFMGGHSDLLAGVAVARDADLVAQLRRARTLGGGTPGALEAFLAVRGLRTLAVRLAACQRSAAVIAERLEAHAGVARVRYPGLATSPSHTVASRFMRGFGAVISFEVETAEHADRLCAALRVVHHATSFGGVESTIERRAANEGQEHLPQGLLRLSIGCEHAEDIWADLETAIDASAGG
ncbi:MAG: PLP-dependent transferase [Planctomycetota bacterium]